jgi:hypothetical protein
MTGAARRDLSLSRLQVLELAVGSAPGVSCHDACAPLITTAERKTIPPATQLNLGVLDTHATTLALLAQGFEL